MIILEVLFCIALDVGALVMFAVITTDILSHTAAGATQESADSVANNPTRKCLLPLLAEAWEPGFGAATIASWTLGRLPPRALLPSLVLSLEMVLPR